MPISLKGQLIMTHYSRRRTNGQIHRIGCRLCHCDRSGSDRDGGVQMKHLGDITKINGAAIEPVDVITGGSPCQDLSVAGKRAGLSGERSGLFMEMVRVIKEMRNATKQLQMRGSDVPVRPRFVVWENVYGAFGSNGGEDFRAVLEEFCRIEGGADISIPRPSDGDWSKSGCIVADRWSLAWRGMDSQYWGVPQRRKRIALVLDYGGQSAPEILFEPQVMRRDSSESGSERSEIVNKIRGSIEDSTSRTYPITCWENKIRGGGNLVIETYTESGFGEYVETDVSSAVKVCGGRRGDFTISKDRYGVRRLTPRECERLQGFPDNFTSIPGAKDSNRYKALGNSIALPQWRFVLGNISKYLPKGATLGSLFDGIGGFPLIWEEIHGKGSARWASEIEKFPIEVTKIRFPEEET